MVGSPSMYCYGIDLRDCFEKILITNLRDLTLGKCRTDNSEQDTNYINKINCLQVYW